MCQGKSYIDYKKHTPIIVEVFPSKFVTRAKKNETNLDYVNIHNAYYKLIRKSIDQQEYINQLENLCQYYKDNGGGDKMVGTGVESPVIS